MLVLSLHARLRVPSSIRHSLRHLFEGARNFWQNSGAWRCEIAEPCHAATYAVIARLDRAIQ
jgi:hypothetical protein